jgi:Restriction endonuclease
MAKPRVKPGKALESLVSSIERVLAQNDKVSVESPKLLPDKVTGEMREHDVLITVSGSHHTATIAIECRDRSRKVTVNDMEGFWSKCQDTGVDQGIVVSPRGFSKTALQKAQHRGIRCLQLSEAKSFNWLLATRVSVRSRRVLHTSWTFFPEKDLDPKPAAFTILSKDGEPVEGSNLVAVAYKEFRRIPETNFDVGRGAKKIIFPSPGLLLRDDTTGTTHAVVRALAEVHYEGWRSSSRSTSSATSAARPVP